MHMGIDGGYLVRSGSHGCSTGGEGKREEQSARGVPAVARAEGIRWLDFAEEDKEEAGNL